MEARRGGVFATRVPLDPIVLFDLEELLVASVAGGLRSFASFRQLCARRRALDLFQTKSCGKRQPLAFESHGEYAALLLEACVRRLVDSARIFEVRLGALYLTLLLHECQPQRPRQPIPVLEV